MLHGLASTLKRGRELAHKRRHVPSTAHVLVALFQSDADVRDLCLGLGVSEGALLGMLGHDYEERPNAIDLAIERGLKLASALALPEVSAMHILLALAREPRCAANLLMQGLGLTPDHVTRLCLARIEAPAHAHAADARTVRAREMASVSAAAEADREGLPGLSVRQGRASRGRSELASEAAAPAEGELEASARTLHRAKLQESRRSALLAEELAALSSGSSGAPDADPRRGQRLSRRQRRAHDGRPGRGLDSTSAGDGASDVEPDGWPQLLQRSQRGHDGHRAPQSEEAGSAGADPEPDSPPQLLTRHRQIQDGRRRALLAEETESKLLRRAVPPDAPAQGDAGPKPIDAPPPPELAAIPPATDEHFQLDPERFPLLSGLGQNLTGLAAEGRLDPVVGRDADVQRVLDVLARRRANNPLLVGAPGVGKTAIAHGVAHAFVRAAREAAARPRLLIELSISSLLSGTGVRGALSERVQQLRREVEEAAGRVLLFIDEIHGLLGHGEPDSLGNELKTALARGELPLLGATTDAEYRRVFERDAALARRFTRVDIAEPKPREALEILRLIAPHYAEHHGVRYEPDALEAAVEMSVRYLPQRQLPDKAIALMDQAGARAQRNALPVVDVRAVAGVVSELAGVPIERLLMRDGQALLALEAELARRVVGQSAAIGCIANALRKSAAGFRGSRPLGTFLFAGPTGVGKTELAKAISDVLFPGISWTRIDMSELSQAHGVARLLGAPPGYLGHDEGGQLTEAVRNRPYQLVLLDEIEKAHMEVLLALLPLLDEGRLTDGRGRTVDFTNTVIVMTSNLGAESAVARARIGFDADTPVSLDGRERALAAVRAALPPELWNRIDEPLYFAPLAREDVAEIARRLLAALVELARTRHGIEIEIEPSAIDALIAAGGFDPALGARPMRRTIGRLVESPLAHGVLAGELVAGARVTLRGDADRIELVTDARPARVAG